MVDRFTVDAYVYRDGTITATSEDIPGLVVEATNTKEFMDELQWVSKDLLMANLGLDEARVQESTISLRWLNAPARRGGPLATQRWSCRNMGNCSMLHER